MMFFSSFKKTGILDAHQITGGRVNAGGWGLGGGGRSKQATLQLVYNSTLQLVYDKCLF